MSGEGYLARFRKDLPFLPERLGTLLPPLLAGISSEHRARAWLRTDRLTVLPRLNAVLGAELLSWCDIGLSTAGRSVAELLDLAETLNNGALSIYDPRPERANAVHIPLGVSRALQRARAGASLPRGEPPAVASYEEGYGALRRSSRTTESARRRRAAIWARDRYLAGQCPTPEAVRARGEAGREEQGGASAAVSIPPGGVQALRPLLMAWMALVERPERADLLWAASHDQLASKLADERIRRTSDGRKWFGLCTLDDSAKGPSQVAARALLCTLSTTPYAADILGGTVHFGGLSWPTAPDMGSPVLGALTLGFDSEQGQAWIEADVLLQTASEEVIGELNRWFWSLLPGSGPCAVARHKQVRLAPKRSKPDLT